MPENAELIGVMVYNCVSGNLWSRLMDDVTEIIPRTVYGYKRYW